MVKVKLIISQDTLYLTQFTRNKSGNSPISMPYGSLAKLIIGCVVMLLTSSGMEQDLHTKTSK